MKNMANLTALLFDFDGTLTRPGGIDFAAIKKTMGCPPDEPILEYMERLPDSEMLRAREILERFESDAAAAALPNEGAESLIEFLRGYPVRVGILTRNTRISVITALRNFQRIIPDDFEIIVTREDVSMPKPHPEGIHLAGQRLGVDPSGMGIIGDYRFDVEAGRRAGTRTFFLCNGVSPAADIEADYFVDTLAELKSVLAGILS